jgi:uncharacterized protein (TIGR00369 family)
MSTLLGHFHLVTLLRNDFGVKRRRSGDSALTQKLMLLIVCILATDNHEHMTHSTVINQISAFMNERIPFQKYLGIRVTKFDAKESEVRFQWKDELVGNAPMQILHGGATATALDTAGGVVIMASVIERLDNDLTAEQIVKHMARCGTIDLRVDYVRPGRGKEFITTATIIRSGSRVAVARMEMHNEEGMLIAFGTGTYIVS